MKVMNQSIGAILGPVSLLVMGQVANAAVSPLFAWQTSQVNTRMEKGW